MFAGSLANWKRCFKRVICAEPLIRRLRVAPNAVPVLMDPETLRAAKLKCPLDPDQLAAIRRDLTLHPAIALADTLEAIQTANAWIEQETLIDNIGTID